MVNMQTVSDHFSFKRERAYTGKVQYAHDESVSVTTDFGPWLRGEVKAIASAEGANGLVASGLFAHVAGDTPVGVPQSVKDLYQLAKKTQKESKPKKEADPKISDAGASGTTTTTTTTDQKTSAESGGESGIKTDGGKPATADSK